MLREGFGNVVIEAAAPDIPSMVSNIYGLADFVISKDTGFVHEVADINEMVRLFKMIYKNKILVKQLGENARAKVIKNFDSKLITKNWVNFYKEKIKKVV